MRTIVLRPLNSYRSSWANAAAVMGFLTAALFVVLAAWIALASLFHAGGGIALVGLFATVISAAIFPAVLPVLVAAVVLPVLAVAYAVRYAAVHRRHHALSAAPRAPRARLAPGSGPFPRATPG